MKIKPSVLSSGISNVSTNLITFLGGYFFASGGSFLRSVLSRSSMYPVAENVCFVPRNITSLYGVKKASYNVLENNLYVYGYYKVTYSDIPKRLYLFYLKGSYRRNRTA